MQAQRRMFNLVSRLLLAIMIAGLLPLLGVALSALNGYRVASAQATGETASVLDDAALTALQQRTTQTAGELARFLDDRAADTRTAALLPPTPAAMLQFATSHTSQLWYVTGTRAQPAEHRDQFPLYREIIAIDASGRLLAHVVDGTMQNDTGDPGQLAGYLAEAKGLAPNALSVSHLSRLYMPRPADEATAPPGADYIRFNGVYRFIAARRTPDGTFDGAVMLALDARHIMEFVIHILPTAANQSAVWPDYDSGNYAYLFDDQGWTIAHPRLWTVRGDDANGQPVSAVTAEMSAADRNQHPFNAPLGGWADPNLPVIFSKALMGTSGFVITVNQQNVRKATTYAPIPFTEGAYRTTGVFAMLAIGANTAEFHRNATIVAGTIEAERTRLGIEMAIVVAGAFVLLALAGTTISQLLVRPLRQLTGVARQLEKGTFDEKRLAAIRERRFADEVTVLADVFAEMGRQVVRREQQLRTRITELHIQIDSHRRQQQVEEITETDYFRNLRATASRMRAGQGKAPAAAGRPMAENQADAQERPDD